jgi:predicted nucleotidyltransferase
LAPRRSGWPPKDSDDDLRGIYLPPARLHWSLRRLPEQLEFADDQRDEVYWELEKFLRLALKANPNVLETLWTPLVLLADETAQELRAIRQAFLSKHVYKTYSGYVLSQFRRMANAYKQKGTYKPKHAMHLIRLLHSGIAALQTGEIRIDVANTATSCSKSVRAICGSRRSSGGHWNWTSDSSRRSSGRTCPSSRTTGAWTIS